RDLGQATVGPAPGDHPRDPRGQQADDDPGDEPHVASVRPGHAPGTGLGTGVAKVTPRAGGRPGAAPRGRRPRRGARPPGCARPGTTPWVRLPEGPAV